MGTFLRWFGFNSVDDRVDEATGLTEKQKKLVQNTWAILRKDPVATGVAVMSAFFKKYPEYQQHFEVFKDIPLHELPSNKRFQAHCASIITALNNVIDSLHDPGLVEANLISLAERHKKRGQTKEQFENLKEVVLEVLGQALKKQFTQDVSIAWNKTLDVAFAIIAQVYNS